MIGFVLPSLVTNLENGESTEQIAGVVASWICYLNQFPDLVDDPRSAELIDLKVVFFVTWKQKSKIQIREGKN